LIQYNFAPQHFITPSWCPLMKKTTWKSVGKSLVKDFPSAGVSFYFTRTPSSLGHFDGNGFDCFTFFFSKLLWPLSDPFQKIFFPVRSRLVPSFMPSDIFLLAPHPSHLWITPPFTPTDEAAWSRCLNVSPAPYTNQVFPPSCALSSPFSIPIPFPIRRVFNFQQFAPPGVWPSSLTGSPFALTKICLGPVCLQRHLHHIENPCIRLFPPPS